MDHFEKIYASKAVEYHRMIDAEDVEGHLLPALQAVVPLSGKRILDLGTGTGRIPLLLADMQVDVIGLDLNFPMLREQVMQCEQVRGEWPLLNADMRSLPLPDGWADVVVAGWSIGHLRSWFSSAWQYHIGRILKEMHRVVSPRGALIVLETMTTGSTQPAPPTPDLAQYYAWLEAEWGFQCTIIQTDYQFADVQEAVALTEFFFGPDLSACIRANNWSRLPEWTGVWWKHV